ncbi:MAG TPA: SOS response-associated peptidase [Candidatus Limnocylindria bacterium]
MCGRFAQPRSADELARIFHARAASQLEGGRFNVAPTDPILAVVERHAERVLDEFRWGLIPVYATSRRGAARLINARSEAVETSGAFRVAFQRQRCIIPADAFYEWRRPSDADGRRAARPQPFAIRLATSLPMAFAGLWSTWHDPVSAERVHTASILTGPPNALVASVHDRMPVILDASDWSAWLDESASPETLRALLRPAPAEAMTMYAVSPAVNDVRSDGAGLLEPISRWQPSLWADSPPA